MRRLDGWIPGHCHLEGCILRIGLEVLFETIWKDKKVWYYYLLILSCYVIYSVVLQSISSVLIFEEKLISKENTSTDRLNANKWMKGLGVFIKIICEFFFICAIRVLIWIWWLCWFIPSLWFYFNRVSYFHSSYSCLYT